MTLGIQVFTWDRHNKWDWDKLVNLIPALLLLIIGSPTEMHIQINDKKNNQRFPQTKTEYRLLQT
jgi:hypothetical protein